MAVVDRMALEHAAEDGQSLAMLQRSEYWPALQRLLDELKDARVQDVLNSSAADFLAAKGRYFGVLDVTIEMNRRIRDGVTARQQLRGHP